MDRFAPTLLRRYSPPENRAQVIWNARRRAGIPIGGFKLPMPPSECDGFVCDDCKGYECPWREGEAA